MEKICCIAVDDSAEALYLIEKYISLIDELELLASFTDSTQALSYLKKHQEIELVFLDQEMPDLTGLDFVDIIEESTSKPPFFIFTTGHTECAIDLYDYYHVIGFLEKPVEQRRFIKAIQKVSRLLRSRADGQFNQQDDYLMIETSVNNKKLIHRVAYSDILVIESVKNYITFHTNDEQITVRVPLTSVEDNLPSEIFIRTHRAYIINHRRLSKIVNSEKVVIMQSGKKVPFGKVYYNNIYQKLAQKSLKDIN